MIDKSKTYRTRDGREVRIYATDGGHENCMTHGAAKNKRGYWEFTSWYTSTGKYLDDEADHPHDLIEVRPRHKRTVWLNVYHDCISRGFETKDEADAKAVKNCRLACIKVDLDFKEGEGL